MTESNGSNPTQAEFLNSLLSGGKLPKGFYGEHLVAFADESDEPFINPRETWPMLKNRKVSSIYQGFNSAKNEAELGSVITVKMFDSECYIVHNERAGVVMSAQDENDESEGTDDEG